MLHFLFKNSACCNTLYAALDKAWVITLSLPLICLMSRLYSCKVKLYLTSLWFLFFILWMKVRGLWSVKTSTGCTVVPKYTSKCSNAKMRAILFNSGVISLVLVKLFGEVWNRVIYPIFTNLHENSTTPYVTGIYGQLELFLKVWCYQNWFTDQYGFDFVETIFGFLWPNTFDILCQQILSVDWPYQKNSDKTSYNIQPYLDRWSSFLVLGVGNFFIASTLALIGLTMPWPTTWPKYTTVPWQNSLLTKLTVNLACDNFSNKRQSCPMCCSQVWL